MLSLQLSEILLAVKNNNPQKLPREDEEGFESRQKLLKALLSGLGLVSCIFYCTKCQFDLKQNFS